MLGERESEGETGADTLGVMEDADWETCVHEMVQLRWLGVAVGAREPVGERLVLGESLADQLRLSEGDPGDGEPEGLGLWLKVAENEKVIVGLSWRVLLLDGVGGEGGGGGGGGGGRGGGGGAEGGGGGREGAGGGARGGWRVRTGSGL